MVAQAHAPRTLQDTLAEISDLQNIASEKRQELADTQEQLKQRLAEARQFLDNAEAEIDEGVVSAPIPTLPTTGPTPKRPPVTSRPVVTSVQPKHGAIRTTPIAVTPRPVAAPVATVTQKAKVQPSERNYGQELTLPEAIWDALDRNPATYKSIISPETRKPIITDEYSDASVGLKVSEIKEVIEAERKWVSSSNNISPQVQGVIGKLKHEGKLARNEADRRYFVVDGAELYGPPFNADGSPMTEQSDGTFVTSANEVFMNLKGDKPFKKRRKNDED